MPLEVKILDLSTFAYYWRGLLKLPKFLVSSWNTVLFYISIPLKKCFSEHFKTRNTSNVWQVIVRRPRFDIRQTVGKCNCGRSLSTYKQISPLHLFHRTLCSVSVWARVPLLSVLDLHRWCLASALTSILERLSKFKQMWRLYQRDIWAPHHVDLQQQCDNMLMLYSKNIRIK